MIEWIKTVFKDRPDTSTPINSVWLNKLQDWIKSIAEFHDAKVFVVTDFLSGWTELAADRKPTIIQTGNVIQITGAVRYGTVGGTAFSLPPEFRPSTLMMFPCVTSGGLGYIEVRPSGQVVPSSGSDFFYLNSITYYRKKQ